MWQERVSRLIEARAGLVLSESTKQRLDGFIERRCAALGLATPEKYIRTLEAEQLPAELQEIVNTVTVSKTAFFRYPKHIDAVCQHLLPALDRVLDAGSPIHIWCTAVSSGEEAYSLAIALEHSGWFGRRPITLFGTDINTASLARAKRGEYHLNQATREMFPEYAWNYLEIAQGEHRFRVAERVRARVQLAHANLNALTIRTDIAWHLVLCCNVLIYFSETNRRRVISDIQVRMAEHAALLLGGAEITAGSDPRYRVHNVGGCFAHLRGAWYGVSVSDPSEPTPRSPQATESAAPVAREPKSLSGGAQVPQNRAVSSETVRVVTSYDAGPRRVAEASTTRTEPERWRDQPHGVPNLWRDQSPSNPWRDQSQPQAEPNRWRDQSRSLLDAKQFDEACKVLEVVRERDPFCEEAHFLYGQALRALGRRDEAEGAFRRAVFLDPDFALARYELGFLRHLQGDFTAAAREYQRVLASLSSRRARAKASGALGLEEARGIEKFMEQMCVRNRELALAGLLPDTGAGSP